MAAVPGLNGIHTWGAVTLNDLSVWPRVRVLRIPGLHTLPDLEDGRDALAGLTGEKLRSYVDRGKAVVYEAKLEAQSQSDLEDLRADLLAAFMQRDGRMSIVPLFGDGPSFYYDARVMACDIPEEHPPDENIKHETKGFERTMTLGLRMHDPRFFRSVALPMESDPIVAESGTPLPWTLPVRLNAPGTSAGAITVTNAGTAPADFYIDLWGPVRNPGLVSLTLNREIRLNLELSVDQFVRLDFRDRSIKVGGNVDAGTSLNRDLSNWWDGNTPALIPGVNQLRYRGEGLADPAHAVGSFNEAQWG